MTVKDFTKYKKARDRAQARAEELTAYVKENTRYIQWPEGMSPDDLHPDVERVFFDSEAAWATDDE